MTHDMRPLPEVHSREESVERAYGDLFSFLIAWQEKHQLTYAEQFLCQTRLLAQLSQRVVAVERRV